MLPMHCQCCQYVAFAFATLEIHWKLVGNVMATLELPWNLVVNALSMLEMHWKGWKLVGNGGNVGNVGNVAHRARVDRPRSPGVS